MKRQAKTRLPETCCKSNSATSRKSGTWTPLPASVSCHFVFIPNCFPLNLWTSSSAGEALAVRYDTTLSGIGPDQHATCIWFAPLPVVKAIFDRALAENKFLVPEYVTPVISVEGEPLPLSDFVRPTDEKLRLAGVTRNCEDYPISFSVTFYLTSPEKMLAAETRRTRLFGALIGGAVLAALAGLLAARRAFYSQHRLSEMKKQFCLQRFPRIARAHRLHAAALRVAGAREDFPRAAKNRSIIASSYRNRGGSLR